jgi:hypothetical protein
MNGAPNISTADTLYLWYDDILVGRIRNPYCSENTWYGEFEQLDSGQRDAVRDRIFRYVAFCEDWNERTLRDPANAPNASEFDNYRDFVDSTEWHTKTPQGDASRVECPVFFKGGEITWLSAEKPL